MSLLSPPLEIEVGCLQFKKSQLLYLTILFSLRNNPARKSVDLIKL